MAAEEDNFDIDIYGDGDGDYHDEGQVEPDTQDHPTEGSANKQQTATLTSTAVPGSDDTTVNGHDPNHDSNRANEDVAHKIDSTDESALDPLHLPKHAPQMQGLKRKEGADDRLVDPGATVALFISELHWWITDDDVRGWANQSECEDELEDITFSEHKVNGKSKGQAYVLFKSPQAATAAKQKIESFGDGQKYRQRFTVSYTNPFTNPFKTLPKDGPMRTGNQGNRATSGGYSGSGAVGGAPQTSFNTNGGYRGRGGGYNSRGGVSSMGGGYNRGGYQQPQPGSFQGSSMNGFQSAPMGGMPSYNSFQNRGGMMGGMRGGGGSMGMRGGRGSMSPSAMMGMPMGAMNMGGMPNQMGSMGMAMPQMNGAMGMQGTHDTFGYPRHTQKSLPIQNSSYPTVGAYHPGGTGVVFSSSAHAASHNMARQSDSAPVSTPHRTVNSDHSVGRPLNFGYEAGSTGFQGQPHYNPAFFAAQGAQTGGMPEVNWNPHGAKRTRQE